HDKTFARFRSYAPWNAYRGFPDPERQVVTRGSVLTFTFHGHEPDKTLKQLRELISDGVGNGRAEGLGKVWVNPPVLASETYSTSPRQHLALGDGTEASRPSAPVLAVIEQ